MGFATESEISGPAAVFRPLEEQWSRSSLPEKIRGGPFDILQERVSIRAGATAAWCLPDHLSKLRRQSMETIMLKYTAVGILAVFLTYPAAAHDYWLQPQQYVLSPDESTDVQLFVGDHFISESERSFQAKRTVAFQVISRSQTLDLKAHATDGQKPVCTITPTKSGNHLVVMERDWSHIEIDAKKFDDYLRHEGLSNIVKLRRNAGEENTAGRERYRRYLKTLVQVGGRFDETYKKRIGHRLEILPQANPYLLDEADSLTVSVLFEGKPLRGARVAAYNRRGDETKTQEARTNEDGQVHFTLDRSGSWLIRLVHMQRCHDVPEIEWESYWAAYSFQIM